MRPIPAVRRAQGFRAAPPEPVAIIGWVGTGGAVVAIQGGEVQTCGVQDLTVFDESIDDAIERARSHISG
jgi:hypothetical protein